MLPMEGSLIDIVFEKLPALNSLVIGRFRVLRYDESRSMYLIQLIETRQEDDKHGNSKEP